MLNNYIVYYQKGNLFSYNVKSLRASKMELPNPEDIVNARLEKNQVYILRSNQLDIYSFQQK